MMRHCCGGLILSFSVRDVWARRTRVGEGDGTSDPYGGPPWLVRRGCHGRPQDGCWKAEVSGRVRRVAMLDEPARVGIGSVSDRDVRILAVDDHRAFREALRDLIAAAPGFVLVGQASSGEEALRVVESLSPELVFMDVVMPGMGGIAATRAILSRRPEVVVVLISVDDPALYPGASALGDGVLCVRKQDLRPQQLRQLWDARLSNRKPLTRIEPLIID
jgi:CheY-like chemotaxis protein